MPSPITSTSRPAKPRHTVVLVRAAEEEGTKLVGSVTQLLHLGGRPSKWGMG